MEDVDLNRPLMSPRTYPTGRPYPWSLQHSQLFNSRNFAPVSKLPRLRPLYLSLMMTLWFLCSPSGANEVIAKSSCLASWWPADARFLRWVSIETNRGALVVGSEVIARISFSQSQIILLDRENLEDSPIPTSTEPDSIFTEEDSIHIRSPITITLNTSCYITVFGIVQHVTDFDLLTQAKAWEILGRARAAEHSGAKEIAAHAAREAFDLLNQTKTCFDSERLQIASFAIERLLDAGEQQQAISVFREPGLMSCEDLPESHPSRIRFNLVYARLLTFSENIAQALDLRLSLQSVANSTFGSLSEESLLNQIRTANLFLEMNRFAEAQIPLENALEKIRRSRKVSDPLSFLVTTALANTLTLMGFEQDALILLINFRDTLNKDRGATERQIIGIQDQIARIEIRLGRLELALGDASDVFVWRRRNLGFSNSQTLESTWLLSRLYKELGRYATARALVVALLDELGRPTFIASKKLKLNALGTLASIEAGEGNLEAAQDTWLMVAMGYAELSGAKSSDAVSSLLNYALLSVLNGHGTKICANLRERLSEWKESLNTDEHLEAFADILQGMCLLDHSSTKNYVAKGLAQIESAWWRLRMLDGEGGDSTIYALSLLARANLKAGNRAASKAYLHSLVAATEMARAKASIGSLMRDSWFSKWLNERDKLFGYRSLALLHAEDGELEEALQITELARDRELQDRWGQENEPCDSWPPEKREKLRALDARIEMLNERIAISPDVLAKVEIESDRVDALGLREELLSKEALGGECENHTRFKSISDFKYKALPTRTGLVSIQHTGDKWWAIVLTHERPLHFVTFNTDADLGVIARAWIGKLRGEPVRAWRSYDGRILLNIARPDGAVGKFLSKQELAKLLSRGLVEPLLKLLPDVRDLIIVAEDDLVELPFGALKKGGAYAIESLRISYAPSIATYFMKSDLESSGSWRKDLFALAANTPEVPRWSADTADPFSHPSDLSVGIVDFFRTHPLKFARLEVEEISEKFPPDKVEVFVGNFATKSAILAANRDGSLKEFRYVHLAAHAFSFRKTPAKSMLLFGPSNGEDLIDVGLSATELSNLKMNSELLVLSGCNTGIGQYEPGQGLLGLAYAALSAGNHFAILSLWQISDDLTQKFMVDLYEFLRSGMTPRDALAETQRRFARSDDQRVRDPSTWAAFILYGG